MSTHDAQTTLDQITLIQQEGIHHALRQLTTAINVTINAQLPQTTDNNSPEPKAHPNQPQPHIPDQTPDTLKCSGKCQGKRGNPACGVTKCTKRCGHIPPKYTQECPQCQQCQVNLAQYLAQVIQIITPAQLMHTHCQCPAYRKSISRYYTTAQMQHTLQVIDIFHEHQKETQRQVIKLQQAAHSGDVIHNFFTAANQQGEQLIGRTIKKHFGTQSYKGKITKYIRGLDFYAIKYADGDREEMTLPEVQCYIQPKLTKGQELLLTKRNPLELNYFVFQDPQVEEISQLMHNLKLGKIKARHLINWDYPIQFSTITRASQKRKGKPSTIASNQQLCQKNSAKKDLRQSYDQMKPGQSQSESENEEFELNKQPRKKTRLVPDADTIERQSSTIITRQQGINKRKYSVTDESTTLPFRELGEEKPKSTRMAKRSRVSLERSQLENETSVAAPTTQGVLVVSRASVQTQYRQQQTEKVVTGNLGVGAGSRTSPSPRLFDMFNRTGVG